MKTYQNVYQDGKWDQPLESVHSAHLVLLFGDRDLAADSALRAELVSCFPEAEIIGCTTSGEIQNTTLLDGSLCLTAVSFDSSRVSVVSDTLNGRDMIGFAESLGSQLEPKGLRAVFVLSDGHYVNATELLKGLEKVLPKGVAITGGLAGDATRFEATHVWHNDSIGEERVLLCGFYGEKIHVRHGCAGGWSPFGPVRTITKSNGNILHSLDGQPALELYTHYLGKYAEDLPASALLFPLMVVDESEGTRIRTILDIDVPNNAMIFAGDIPEGATAQLMRSNSSGLVGGANKAAVESFKDIADLSGDGLAILISCVGRRLVLKSSTDEEIESVAELVDDDWAITGFYSYGELSPFTQGGCSMLHNQTMTISAFYESN